MPVRWAWIRAAFLPATSVCRRGHVRFPVSARQSSNHLGGSIDDFYTSRRKCILFLNVLLKRYRIIMSKTRLRISVISLAFAKDSISKCSERMNNMNEMSRKLIKQEETIRDALLEALDTEFTWKMVECIQNRADEAHCNARWGNVSHIFVELKSKIDDSLLKYEMNQITAETVIREIADATAEAKNNQRDGLLLIEEIFGIPEDSTSVQVTEDELEKEYGTTDWKKINQIVFPKIYSDNKRLLKDTEQPACTVVVNENQPVRRRRRQIENCSNEGLNTTNAYNNKEENPRIEYKGNESEYKLGKLEDGTYAIMKYLGFDEKELRVPSIVGDKKITAIGKEAFRGLASAESVIISDGIIYIGESAFAWCKSLKSVYLSKDLLALGKSAFGHCESLIHIELPSSLSYIKEECFFGCRRLENITFSNQLKELSQYAFCYCSNLKEIVLPNSLRVIGESAFSSCTALRRVILNDGLVAIHSNAFKDCRYLKAIVIPKSVTEFGRGIFSVSVNEWDYWDKQKYNFRTEAKELTTYCYAGSNALEYARKNGHNIENAANL